MTREEFLKKLEVIGIVNFTFSGMDTTLFFKDGGRLDQTYEHKLND